MEHQLSESGGAIVIAFSGDIDLQTSPEARKALLGLVGKGQPILVDLSGVGYIDSSGVASLVECLQSVKKSGQKLALVSVSDGALRVLQLARLDKVFVICGTVERGRSVSHLTRISTRQIYGGLILGRIKRFPQSRKLKGSASLPSASSRPWATAAFSSLESVYWLLFGVRERQPVRLSAVIQQMMEIGINAIPIILMLTGTIGVMLAIQGIHTLRIFGAESRVTIGIAFSVVREFAPLITGILVAGRSGSALAARIGTMKINQEIDALKVMGINPTRFLVVPALLAMLVMVPALTLLGNFMGLFAAGLYVNADLGISLAAYAHDTIDILSLDDLGHGLGKSCIFAIPDRRYRRRKRRRCSGRCRRASARQPHVLWCRRFRRFIVTDMLFAFVATR